MLKILCMMYCYYISVSILRRQMTKYLGVKCQDDCKSVRACACVCVKEHRYDPIVIVA